MDPIRDISELGLGIKPRPSDTSPHLAPLTWHSLGLLDIMINRFKELTGARLRKAAAIKERIEQLERELTGILGIPEQATIGGTVRRHRRMSAAARAKISAAAKARWAKIRAKK